MRRINKKEESLIVQQGLAYKKGRDNSRIADLLEEEQNSICAYTEEYLGRADKAEIEHFNPTLKYTDDDGYKNWFLVKAQWNNEKGSEARWLRYQPLLHPTDTDFETRIKYDRGHYVLNDEIDIKARNLRAYLKLDDEELAKQRISYVNRLKWDLKLSGLSNQEFIDFRLLIDPKEIYFIRAIEEELHVTVNFDLLKTQ